MNLSENCSETSGRLWKFKRDEVPDENAELTIVLDSSQLFKYKAALLGKPENAVDGTNSSVKEAKIVVPLKYLSNFWRSLEMPLINCKVYLELINCIEDCILSSSGNSAKFEITDAKLLIPIVTLSTKDSATLTKELNKEFKKSLYWNSYETKTCKSNRKWEKTCTNYLTHHFKAPKDYLFLLMLLLHLGVVTLQMIQQV